MKKKIYFFASFLLIISIAVVSFFLLKKKQCNLIIFTLDTTRADYIDTGNGALSATPNIKSIAEKSTVFTHAYTISPITAPAHVSLFTGKYPYKTNVYNNGEKYDHKHPTLQQLLKKKGYKTGAVVSLGVLHKKFGLAKYFDYYNDDFRDFIPGYFLPAHIVTERSLSLLNEVKDDKFFVWLHYSDPHDPYAPPEYNIPVKVKFNNTDIYTYNLYHILRVSTEITLKKGNNILSFDSEKLPSIFKENPIRLDKFSIKDTNDNPLKNITYKNAQLHPKKPTILLNNKTKIMIHSKSQKTGILEFESRPEYVNASIEKNFYKAEVEYMDKEIGKILDYLKKNQLLKNTVIAFIGDHGEGLGEYQSHFGHIHFLNPQYIKIPFIIYFPNEQAKKIDTNVSILDFMPTLLKRFNIKKRQKIDFDGKIMSKIKKDRFLFSFTYKPEAFNNAVSLIHHNKQYIVYRGLKNYDEFFDLEKTNGYLKNDNFIHKKEYINIIERMKKACLQQLEIAKRRKSRGKIHEKTKEILKSLGYF